MKKLTYALLALFACVFLPLYAADVSDLTYTTNGGEVTITDCDTSASGTLVIPDTIEGNSVTSIASGTFSGCISLTSITIPDSVTNIGRNAFFGCSSLTNITLGEGITSIGQSTFANCTSLTGITIPDGVTSIGRSAFTVCTSLTDITFPDSVTSLGDFVFYRCLSLASITFWGAAPSVEENTFKSARAGGVVLVPDDFLTSFGEIGANWNGLIIGVNRLEQLTWTTNGGEVTITDCDTSASGTLVIPDTIEGNPVTGIGRAAFEDCKSLTSITIPDSVTSIGDYAFSRCYNLTSVAIPDSVTSIGVLAFQKCSELTNVTIPDSVTSIASGTFSGCSSLTSITIPDSVTTIGQNAFLGCSSLISVTIPDSVTTIIQSAFFNCSSLTSVTIGNSVTSIPVNAFRGCSSLTSVTIPNGVTSIERLAFYDCTSLASITFTGPVPTTLGENIFGNIAAGAVVLVSDGFLSSFGEIGANWNGLIIDVNRLEQLTWTTTGGEVTITDCDTSASGTLVIPDTIEGNPVTGIGRAAFEDCKSLTSITIPDSVTSIGDYAFTSCSSLTSITFQGAAPTVGIEAFLGLPDEAVTQVPNENLESYQWNGLTVSTADQSDAIADLEARPTQEAYDAVVAERDSKIEIINQLQVTVEANNSKIAELEKRPKAEQLATAIAERDARPTQEAYNTVVAERDARSTTDELQDARNGSVVIASSNGEATISFNIEESEDLKTWQVTVEKITKSIQLKDGKKFYRFALDK